MMNIGMRPTYNGTTLSLEVHLFDFDGDLYGQTLTIDFLRRIREDKADCGLNLADCVLNDK